MLCPVTGSPTKQTPFMTTNLNNDVQRDQRTVFVVYGRHTKALDAMVAFLSSIGLQPLEWSHLVRLTGKGSPYVGEVLDAGFRRATAAVVLFTPDDEVRLRAQFWSLNEPMYETTLTGQARPNVIFEAGMALGIAPDRTILVEFGTLRPISDLSGRHVIRINNMEQRRRELAERLETAGCIVDLSDSGWKVAGDFDAAIHDLVSTEAEKTIAEDLEPGYSVESSVERGRLGNGSHEITYPQIQGLSDSYIQRRVNMILDQEFKKLAGLIDDQGEPTEDYDISSDEGPQFTWVSYEIGLTTGSLISVRADQSFNFGGAHPTNVSTGFVIDLVSGYRYSLHDLFRADQNYMGILRAHIHKSLERDFKDDPTFEDMPPEPEEDKPHAYDFYFSEREIVIINLFYPHALQALWARIPFSDLASISDPRGPLYRLLASRSSGGLIN